MKPVNERKPLILEDGEPVQCRFTARGAQPSFIDRCETEATVQVDATAFREWRERHPGALISVLPGEVYLCDTHERTIGEFS